ncbi:M23 family metallopeptidase [Candidatus Dependentiae bacterium]|nr:M23 family metallopeptidase [Candidatus Dependentiae bacterium]
MKNDFDYYSNFYKYERVQKLKRAVIIIIFICITVSLLHFIFLHKSDSDTSFEQLLKNSTFENNNSISMEESSEIEYLPDDYSYYSYRGNSNVFSGKGGVPAGMPADGYISSRFGYRRTVFSKSNFFHQGVDIRAPYGTKIYSTAAGKVEEAGFRGSYGFCVILNHNNGFKTLYAHCQQLTVKKNQFVQRGQLIGYVGSTGASTGSHVHYEIKKNGNAVDPERFFGYNEKSWQLAGKNK